MSNTAVGPIYDHIISEVINSVRVDFEEGGVDEGALEDLKKVRHRHPLHIRSQPTRFLLHLHLHRLCRRARRHPFRQFINSPFLFSFGCVMQWGSGSS
jgi:hypothetical protein